MTRRLFSSFGSIALLACLTLGLSISASAEHAKVRVHVPFDFQVNGMAMPAGQYYFEAPVGSGMVFVTMPSGERHATIALPLGNPATPKSPQVVFERLGDRYRLCEVWLNGATVGSGLRRTKAEKEYARQFGKGSLVALSAVKK
jgi:hypothetical protein